MLQNIQNALKEENSLRTLRLGDCKIDDDGALIIANILENNQSIKELELTQNNITNKGVNYIYDKLQNNKALEKLHLSINPITSLDGIEKLKTSIVKAIDFEACDIKGIISNNILDALKESRIETLDLSNNAINLENSIGSLAQFFLQQGKKISIDLRNQNDGTATTLEQKYEDHSCPAQVIEVLTSYPNIILSGDTTFNDQE